MARSVRVALAQVNPTVGDLDGNTAMIRRWYAKAEAAGADIVAFPELVLTGYPPEDLLLKPSFVRLNVERARELAAAMTGPVAVFGFVEKAGNDRLYNAAAVAAGGEIRGVYRKVELPNYGVFDEKRYFDQGDSYPVFAVRGVHVGVTICEDAWIGDGPVREVARRGAEVVININASPYHMGKTFERQVLFRQRALDEKVFFFYLQTVGGQDELVFDGDSLVYDPAGKLLTRGAQFEEELVVADIALPDAPRKPARSATPVVLSAEAPAVERPAPPKQRARRALDPVEEIYTALLLGTRDYVRKNGFTTVVIGLSGGIDSALTAVIAADAVGPENVLGVAMPSRYSADSSLEDAKELATNLGLDFHVIPIEPMVGAFTEALADVFAGREPDVTEENLQARIRGTILMAISNKLRPSIVLTTGNKSEMATGYSTLYGDMAGGFAVLKDVPKTLVYELAAWRNNHGLTAIPPAIFTKAPSAELRPDQKDIDSLPAYEALDPILAAYIQENKSAGEMIAAGFDEQIVRRVVDLVDRAEYKRRQAPPGVKITPRAFGKDWRLPITNGFRHAPKAADLQARASRRTGA